MGQNANGHLTVAQFMFRQWHTLLATVLLLAMLGYVIMPRSGGSRLDALNYPAESAGRLVERHLEFYEGYDSTPGWERGLHFFLFGSREQVENEAVSIYREVLNYLAERGTDAPSWSILNTRARLVVTLAEKGRWQELEAELSALDSSPEESAIQDAVRYGYGRDSAMVRDEPLPGAALLPVGWASDHLRAAVARHAGEEQTSRRLQRRLLARGEMWRQRAAMLSVAVGALVCAGLLVLVKGRGLLRPGCWDAGALRNPWPLFEGLSIAVWSALLGLAVMVALSVWGGSYFRPGLPFLWTTLFASLPMVWLMRYRLFRPSGRGFVERFGLSFRGVGVKRLLAIVLALLAVEWLGTFGIAALTWLMGIESHWSQGVQERMIFGPWETTALGAVNLVLWAPLFEELGFRGLVYTSLRSRWSPAASALLSAGLFSVLHVYSLPGMLSVFWSGLVLAYAYERFRSLVPGILVHMVGNALALSVLLLFYR